MMKLGCRGRVASAPASLLPGDDCLERSGSMEEIQGHASRLRPCDYRSHHAQSHRKKAHRKDAGGTKHLPIILLTGYSETLSDEEAKAAGISEFLIKPVVTRELAETVRRVLDDRK